MSTARERARDALAELVGTLQSLSRTAAGHLGELSETVSEDLPALLAAQRKEIEEELAKQLEALRAAEEDIASGRVGKDPRPRGIAGSAGAAAGGPGSGAPRSLASLLASNLPPSTEAGGIPRFAAAASADRPRPRAEVGGASAGAPPAGAPLGLSALGPAVAAAGAARMAQRAGLPPAESAGAAAHLPPGAAPVKPGQEAHVSELAAAIAKRRQARIQHEGTTDI